MSCAPYHYAPNSCSSNSYRNPCGPQIQCGPVNANVVITSTTLGYNTAGTVIPLTFTITNTGSTPITTPIVLTSTNVAQIVFFGSSIAPLGNVVFTRYYRVTPADLSQPSITFTAHAFNNIGGCPSYVPVTPLVIPRLLV